MCRSVYEVNWNVLYGRHEPKYKKEAKLKIGEHEVTAISNTEAMVGCTKVTLADLDRVRLAINNYKPEPKFKVRDYVRVVDVHCLASGKSGKVVGTPEASRHILVEFAESVFGLSGLPAYGIPANHGAEYLPEHLELIR